MDSLLFEIYNDTYNITPKYNLGEPTFPQALHCSHAFCL